MRLIIHACVTLLAAVHTAHAGKKGCQKTDFCYHPVIADSLVATNPGAEINFDGLPACVRICMRKKNEWLLSAPAKDACAGNYLQAEFERDSGHCHRDHCGSDDQVKDRFEQSMRWVKSICGFLSEEDWRDGKNVTMTCADKIFDNDKGGDEEERKHDPPLALEA